MISFADSRLDKFLCGRKKPLELWWRDDDAGDPIDPLAKLIEISESLDAGLALAAVPDWLSEVAVERIGQSEPICILQHGWCHKDHSEPGAKKIEFGGSLDSQMGLQQLKAGGKVLASQFGEKFVPAFVPPWNRIEDRFLALLTNIPFKGISTFGDDNRGRAYGLAQINTHVDVIDWRGTGSFVGLSRIVDDLIVASTRWPDQAIGLLTHHAAMDQVALTEAGELIAQVRAHPNVIWWDFRDLVREATIANTAVIDT